MQKDFKITWTKGSEGEALTAKMLLITLIAFVIKFVSVLFLLLSIIINMANLISGTSNSIGHIFVIIGLTLWISVWLIHKFILPKIVNRIKYLIENKIGF